MFEGMMVRRDPKETGKLGTGEKRLIGLKEPLGGSQG